MVNKQFGLKNNNFSGSLLVTLLIRVALMVELLQYYSGQEKYRGLCGSSINKKYALPNDL